MKSKFWYRFKIVALSLAGGGMINSVFVNCSGPFQSTAMSIDLPVQHPDIEEFRAPAAAQSNVQIADRIYIESFLRDIFTSSESNKAENDALSSIFMTEIWPTQHHLGGACSLYDDGSFRNCYYVATNQLNSFYAASSSPREGARYQTCRRLVATDGLMNAVIKKLPPRTNTPDMESVIAAIGLFYPSLESPEVVAAKILEADEAAAYNRESVMDRWRLVFLGLCESPGWQVLSE